MMLGFGGNSGDESIIAVFMAIVVVGVGAILFVVLKGLSEWSRNNARPVLRVPARIVARRTNLSVSSSTSGHHHHHHGDHHPAHGSVSTSTSTQYYATFELANGERVEFQLSNDEAGLLLEGDHGELVHQGTRYHGFARRLPDGSFAGSMLEGAALAKSSAPLSGALCVRCEKPLVVGRNQCPACDWTQPG